MNNVKKRLDRAMPRATLGHISIGFLINACLQGIHEREGGLKSKCRKIKR
jgi:hypothetical protein